MEVLLMKEIYIDLMEKVFSAYTDEHIIEYFNDTKKTSIKEHGISRVVANLGILIAHGRKTYLKDLFKEMMDFLTVDISVALLKNGWRAGNEFSIKEIVLCLLEVERSGVYEKSVTDSWRKNLENLVPETTYGIFRKDSPNTGNNWVVFAAASEQLRNFAGMSDNTEMIDKILKLQLELFDENGMYRDPLEPIVYDIATRLQFMVVYNFGYNGKSKKALEDILLKSADLTLYMESVLGEIPYGGRSNQFLHNEAFFSAVFEFYASFFKKRGDMEKASVFKSAAKVALCGLNEWLSGDKLYHIKNYYPNYSQIGCEPYAYFDKYMVSAASSLHLAYEMADDSIEISNCPAENENFIKETSELFHQIFIKFGDYTVQIDTDANKHYDASGIGRIHKKGVPSALCLSVPFAKEPNYVLDIENPSAFSICGLVSTEDGAVLGAEEKYRVLEKTVSDESAFIKLGCEKDGKILFEERLTVSNDGAEILVSGKENAKILFPVFSFDGETKTEITKGENQVSVSYKGHKVTFTSNGKITDLNKEYANRNGHYKGFSAEENLKIEMR